MPILPAGAAPAVVGFGGAGAPDDTGFQVTFAGSQAGTNVTQLGLANQTGMTGFVGERDKGGPIDNSGNQVIATGNGAPTVTTPGPFTIPLPHPVQAQRQRHRPRRRHAHLHVGAERRFGPRGIDLQNPNKTAGPLFRQFGTALDSSVYNGQTYNSPGENHPTTDSSRTFPDMVQLLANNTNADTGDCPAGSTAARVDCYSEFLPRAGYAGPMNFRLTARDNNPGGGGVNSADTTVNLAPGTGPFRVTSPDTALTWVAGTSRTVTWDVAGSAAAPINTANVDIVVSTDGGASFPTVLAANTPNDGSQAITVPDVNTTTARVMVRAVGNIFFDVSNADFTIDNTADMELVSKTDGQDPAFAGETLTYTITARNNGAGDGRERPGCGRPARPGRATTRARSRAPTRRRDGDLRAGDAG